MRCTLEVCGRDRTTTLRVGSCVLLCVLGGTESSEGVLCVCVCVWVSGAMVEVECLRGERGKMDVLHGAVVYVLCWLC